MDAEKENKIIAKKKTHKNIRGGAKELFSIDCCKWETFSLNTRRTSSINVMNSENEVACWGWKRKKDETPLSGIVNTHSFVCMKRKICALRTLCDLLHLSYIFPTNHDLVKIVVCTNAWDDMCERCKMIIITGSSSLFVTNILIEEEARV